MFLSDESADQRGTFAPVSWAAFGDISGPIHEAALTDRPPIAGGQGRGLDRTG
jgi:hypothetical protein